MGPVPMTTFIEMLNEMITKFEVWHYYRNMRTKCLWLYDDTTVFVMLESDC